MFFHRCRCAMLEIVRLNQSSTFGQYSFMYINEWMIQVHQRSFPLRSDIVQVDLDQITKGSLVDWLLKSGDELWFAASSSRSAFSCLQIETICGFVSKQIGGFHTFYIVIVQFQADLDQIIKGSLGYSSPSWGHSVLWLGYQNGAGADNESENTALILKVPPLHYFCDNTRQ